jgi:hypothetical protein
LTQISIHTGFLHDYYPGLLTRIIHMKIRFRGDNVRLRLKRSEVDQIAAGSPIVEETHFPDSVLAYRLEVSEENEIAASFGNSGLVIGLPRLQVREWAGTDQVSLYAEQDIPGVGPLALLIEKDFSCLAPGDHRGSEDDEDTYPHPNADAEGGCKP